MEAKELLPAIAGGRVTCNVFFFFFFFFWGGWVQGLGACRRLRRGGWGLGLGGVHWE